jgi:hypothetical protein
VSATFGQVGHGGDHQGHARVFGTGNQWVSGSGQVWAFFTTSSGWREAAGRPAAASQARARTARG